MSNPNQVPIEDLPFRFESTDQISLDPMSAIEAAKGAAEVRRRQEALRDSAESFMGPIDDPDPEALESFKSYLEQRPAAPEEKPGRREKLPGVPHTSRVETLEESLTRDFGAHYRESHEENNKNMHRDQLIGRWAVADLLGDRTVSIDAQDELIDRVASMKHVADAEKQRMLEAQERRKNQIQDEYVRGLSDEEVGSMPKSDQVRIFDRKEVLHERDLMDRIQAVGIDGLSDEEFRSIRARTVPKLGPDLYEAYIRRWNDIQSVYDRQLGDEAGAQPDTAAREEAAGGRRVAGQPLSPEEEHARRAYLEFEDDEAPAPSHQSGADRSDPYGELNGEPTPQQFQEEPNRSLSQRLKGRWQRAREAVNLWLPRAGETLNLWLHSRSRDSNHPETAPSFFGWVGKAPGRLWNRVAPSHPEVPEVSEQPEEPRRVSARSPEDLDLLFGPSREFNTEERPGNPPSRVVAAPPEERPASLSREVAPSLEDLRPNSAPESSNGSREPLSVEDLLAKNPDLLDHSPEWIKNQLPFIVGYMGGVPDDYERLLKELAEREKWS